MRKLAVALVFLAQCMIVTSLFAQTPAMTNGVSYLTSTQAADGSWSGEGSKTDTLPTTVSVIGTLRALNRTDSPGYGTALSWLQSQPLETTGYLSERINALSVGGTDGDVLLTYRDQITRAWGGHVDCEVNNLDTALALQALKAVNYSDQNVISGALSYLTSTQNPDGGWGFGQGDESNIYMTALTSLTMQQFTGTPSIATAINKATAYLTARQGPDGGFSTGPSAGSGQSPSTVYETALLYLALVGTTTDATVLGRAISYLTSTQLSNGSWDDDPYSTALALRSLYLAENRLVPPPIPTTGRIAGKVIDISTKQPLAGVFVTLRDTSTVNTETDMDGEFILLNVPPGSHTINFSLSGYAPGSVTANVVAGATTNVGSFSLAVDATTGIIKGALTGATDRQALQGVTITVTGSFTGSATTGSDGTFGFTNVPPGAVGITASRTGYYAVTGAGTVVAGGILFFSPQLSATPPPTATGSLTGKVLDGSTSSPIADTTVSISGGPSGGIDLQGAFLIGDIAPGTYPVTISVPGYASLTYQVMIMAGVVIDLQTIYLTPVSQSTTIAGRVTDASTGVPIAGADVGVIGTGISTRTSSEGTYVLSGIPLLEFSLKASAAGYDSNIHLVSMNDHGVYTIELALNPSQGSNLQIVSLATDKDSYAAYEPIVILMDVVNSGSVPISGNVSASIVDYDGQVLDNLQATFLDDNGVMQSRFEFPPGMLQSVAIEWATQHHSPRPYRVIAKVMEGEAGVALGAVVAAIRETRFVIDPTHAIASVALTPLPRFTNLGAAEQVSIVSDLVNRSNVATEVSIVYEWHSPSGLVLHSGASTISLLPAETTKSVLLEAFAFTFGESGEHPIHLQIVSGPPPIDVVGHTISVAPGIRIEPSQSITPSTVIPDGDKRVRLNIRLKGVEQR